MPKGPFGNIEINGPLSEDNLYLFIVLPEEQGFKMNPRQAGIIEDRIKREVFIPNNMEFRVDVFDRVPGSVGMKFDTTDMPVKLMNGINDIVSDELGYNDTVPIASCDEGDFNDYFLGV